MNTTQRHTTQRDNETKAIVEVRETGSYDQRGRQIGMRTTAFECDFTPFTPLEMQCFYRIPAGHYYAVNCHVTRNGVEYGSSQSTEYFATPDERDAYIAKRWKQIINKAKKN